jgi:hypothetical protein
MVTLPRVKEVLLATNTFLSVFAVVPVVVFPPTLKRSVEVAVPVPSPVST